MGGASASEANARLLVISSAGLRLALPLGFPVCDLVNCETSPQLGLRLIPLAASETACEGSVKRSPAFLPSGLG
jgi:hypothetical protein